jgi:hypothetical protein
MRAAFHQALLQSGTNNKQDQQLQCAEGRLGAS